MSGVLITGSRGFLARHLALELRRRGRKVHLLDHKPSPGHIVCDLLDVPRLAGWLRRLRPALIYHLAGTTRRASWDELWRAHVRATAGLLEAVRLSPDPRVRVWCVGSSGEYGETASGPASETDEARPVTPYGASKLCATLTALSYRNEGLQVSAARVFNVLGPGMPEHLSLGSFARQIVEIERGLRPPRLLVGNLSPRRDYVDVRDVTRALVRLGERGPAGEVFNVCSGKAWTMRALLTGLLRRSRAAIRVAPDPARRRKADARICVGSRRKIASVTGWTPAYSLQESLRDTLDWYRGQP